MCKWRERTGFVFNTAHRWPGLVLSLAILGSGVTALARPSEPAKTEVAGAVRAIATANASLENQVRAPTNPCAPTPLTPGLTFYIDEKADDACFYQRMLKDMTNGQYSIAEFLQQQEAYVRQRQELREKQDSLQAR